MDLTSYLTNQAIIDATGRIVDDYYDRLSRLSTSYLLERQKQIRIHGFTDFFRYVCSNRPLEELTIEKILDKRGGGGG